MDLPGRHGAPWTIGEEHLVDRLYREEQKTIHQIAVQAARTTQAVMGRLSLMYFGKPGGVDRLPWNSGDDVQLRELYHGSNGDNDRKAIVKRFGRQPHCIAGRLLEVIPRSQISLSKAGWVGRALSHQMSLSVHSPSRCSSEAALTNLSCAPTPFLKCHRLCKKCPVNADGTDWRNQLVASATPTRFVSWPSLWTSCGRMSFTAFLNSHLRGARFHVCLCLIWPRG